MLSVIIPSHNSEEGLARTLASLVSAAAEGIVREVAVADAGSTDGTAAVAEAAGCLFLSGGGTWGERVAEAVTAMRRVPWLMVLPPHVLLEAGWFRELTAFIERTERNGRSESLAASFRLEYDDYGLRARVAERAIALCSGIFGLPAPEQGLVVSRRLWDRVQRQQPVDDQAALVARIGRRRIHMLRSSAVVIADSGAGCRVPTGPALAGHALAAIGLPARALGARQS
ncbi:MAG: glycosyltransferase [Ancalomicrobiaceae bacterium]|nr:glycosyltransferase [Ancalomicrobiaceae bacterium]